MVNKQVLFFGLFAQALDEEHYPDTPAGSKRPIETSIMRQGPSATRPCAHEVPGFGVGAFGEPPAGCYELFNLAARVQAASYVACYGNKTPKEAFDAQRSRIRRLWGLTAQVEGLRLIKKRRTKSTSPGDSESPVKGFLVKSRVILRNTWNKCQAGGMRPL